MVLILYVDEESILLRTHFASLNFFLYFSRLQDDDDDDDVVDDIYNLNFFSLCFSCLNDDDNDDGWYL